MANDNDFINVFEASALLGVHDQTLRKLARQKKIPAFKVGKEWRFRRKTLVRWADEQHLAGQSNDCSVLVIDDDGNASQELSRLLVRFGCRTRVAAGGGDGLILLTREAPDLVILDLKMPKKMNGPQFLEKLREICPDIPVVVVAGDPNSELIRDAAGYAPIMLLKKPIDPALLERTVRAVMGEKMVARRVG